MKRISILLAATALMTLPAMTLPAMAEQAATTSSSQIQLAQMQKGSTDLKKSEKDKATRPENHEGQKQANPTGAASTGPNVKHKPNPPATDGSMPLATDQKVSNPSVK
jgi:hypothetical protein